jgi:hypothetical protein
MSLDMQRTKDALSGDLPQALRKEAEKVGRGSNMT